MNGRKAKEVRKALGRFINGKTWYGRYCYAMASVGKKPLGMKAIKALAKGKPKSFILGNSFLALIMTETGIARKDADKVLFNLYMNKDK